MLLGMTDERAHCSPHLVVAVVALNSTGSEEAACAGTSSSDQGFQGYPHQCEFTLERSRRELRTPAKMHEILPSAGAHVTRNLESRPNLKRANIRDIACQWLAMLELMLSHFDFSVAVSPLRDSCPTVT